MLWKNKNSRSYSKVSVNGKTIRVSGSNITIINDKIYVDGKLVTDDNIYNNITVIVEGNCNRVDSEGPVEVKGDCGEVNCSGSCKIQGNVTGKVVASGSVHCGDVGGDISASGSVHCSRR